MIRAVHPAEAAVELDLAGERVKVYVHETIEQAIGRYYDQIKKFKKKKAGALAAMEAGDHRKAPAGAAPGLPEERMVLHRFRWFSTWSRSRHRRPGCLPGRTVKKYLEGGTSSSTPTSMGEAPSSS